MSDTGKKPKEAAPLPPLSPHPWAKGLGDWKPTPAQADWLRYVACMEKEGIPQHTMIGHRPLKNPS